MRKICLAESEAKSVEQGEIAHSILWGEGGGKGALIIKNLYTCIT